MKKIFAIIVLALMMVTLMPKSSFAAGIYVSGGGTKYVGDKITLTVTASGAEFNAFVGNISISGPAKIVSCYASSALWIKEPNGAGDFSGALTSPTSSFRIATVTIQGTGVGSGKLTVSGVQLANKGPVVGTSGGSASFTFERRPTPPGTINVTSSSHPDSNASYEETSVALSWEKPSGVTAFAYIWDQQPETTPTTEISGETSTLYKDQAIGTYYFHIKGKNGDGWGPVTHFKVNIKEPDAKVNADLAKPNGLAIEKTAEFSNNIADGTVTGLVIKGYTLPNNIANIKLEPAPVLPEGKFLIAEANTDGYFELLIDYPISAGRYKLSVQGQNDKVLTPFSDVVNFEISQAKGGNITVLTADDTLPPIIPAKKWHEKINYMLTTIGFGVLTLIFMGLTITLFFNGKRSKKLLKSIKIRES